MKPARAEPMLSWALSGPAAALALLDGSAWLPRLAHCALALAAAWAAARVWQTPHPWTAALLVALAPNVLSLPVSAGTATSLVVWGWSPAFAVALAFPFFYLTWGHGPRAWLGTVAVAAVLSASGRPRGDGPTAAGIAAGQPLVLVCAALALPVFTATAGRSSASAWIALLLLLLAQRWAALLVWRANAQGALAGPVACLAAALAALAVQGFGMGRPDALLGVAIVLGATGLPAVLALATRHLAPAWRGPGQGALAAMAGFAMRGLPLSV